MNKEIIFIAYLLNFFSFLALEASEWPIYKGNRSLTSSTVADFQIPLSVKWEKDFKTAIKSPLITNTKMLLIALARGEIVSLNINDGSVIWHKKINAEIISPLMTHKGYIYFSDTDNHFSAMNLKTQDIEWRISTNNKISSSANIYEKGDKQYLVFGSYDNNLYGINIRNGEQLWSYTTESYINGTPSVYYGIILAGGCDSFLHIVNADNGYIKDKFNSHSYIASSVPVRDDTAYFGNYEGVFYAYGFNEKKVIWKFEDPDTGPFIASAAIGNENIYAPSRDNNLYCLDRKTGILKWTFLSTESLEATPVITKKYIVLPSPDGILYFIDKNTGKEIWSFNTGGKLLTTPAVTEDAIYISNSNGRILSLTDKEV